MQQYPPWQLEYAKFTDDAVERIKSYADDTHLEREWMCYVYEQDYGIMVSGESMPHLYRDDSGKEQIFRSKERAEEYLVGHGLSGAVTPVYQLGSVSYGDESRIEVNPESKSTQDKSEQEMDHSWSPIERWEDLHRTPILFIHRYFGRVCEYEG